MTNHSTPSLESLFAIEAANSPQRSTKQKARSKSTDRPIPHTQLYQPSPIVNTQISHGTPFGQSNKASPFASHTYKPPTGAPGYGGERYDWDKGFSAELERELSTDSESRERELIDLDGESGARDAVGIGHLMDKKSGGVELVARKASTSAVLKVDLADMVSSVRPNKPEA